MAANPQTKSTNFGWESDGWLLPAPPTPTTAVHYYSARKLILCHRDKRKNYCLTSFMNYEWRIRYGHWAWKTQFPRFKTTGVPTCFTRKQNGTRCMTKPSVSTPSANTPAKLRGYWTKVHQIFITRRTRWKVLWESTTPRKSLLNGAAYKGPFRHLGTSRSPIVGTINHHHACDA